MVMQSNIMRSAIIGLAAFGVAAAAAPASASVVFNEGTFATSSFSLTPTYVSGPNGILAGQSTAGNPGTALRFGTFFAGAGAVSLGVVINSFTYDPAVSGVVTALTFAVQKQITTTATGTFTNYFRPLIKQGGNYYLAEVLLGTNTGSTPYLNASAGLGAANFLQYDYATNTFGTAHPDFAGTPLQFGIAQVTTSTTGGFFSFLDYDNLSVTVAVPEMATWAMMIVGFGMIGGAMRSRRTRTRVRFA